MQEDATLQDEQNQDDDLFVHHNIVADHNQSPLRLDKFLMARLYNVTSNRVQNGIKEGFVKVNEEKVKKNYKVRPGDEVIVSLPEPPRDTEVIPENLPINIIF